MTNKSKCSSFYCWYEYLVKERDEQPELAERQATIYDINNTPLPEYWIKKCADCGINYETTMQYLSN